MNRLFLYRLYFNFKFLLFFVQIMMPIKIICQSDVEINSIIDKNDSLSTFIIVKNNSKQKLFFNIFPQNLKIDFTKYHTVTITNLKTIVPCMLKLWVTFRIRFVSSQSCLVSITRIIWELSTHEVFFFGQVSCHDRFYHSLVFHSFNGNYFQLCKR